MITRIVVALALCLAGANASAAQREISASRTETLTAKVKKVDVQAREVTLDKKGEQVTFKAGPDVRNLDQLKEGDVISTTLSQTLTLWLLGEKDAAPELSVGAEVYRSKKGEKPGGLMTSDLSGVATVTAIAPDKTSVTLKGPKGKVVKLAVRNPANLDGVKVGARIGFAYSETLAVDVAAAAPAKAPAAAEKAPAAAEKAPENAKK